MGWFALVLVGWAVLLVVPLLGWWLRLGSYAWVGVYRDGYMSVYVLISLESLYLGYPYLLCSNARARA